MIGENKDEDLMNDLLKLISNKKELERISWDNLGKLIGYSGVGMKKAMIKNSLSLTQLEDVIIKLGLSKEASKLGMKISEKKSYLAHNLKGDSNVNDLNFSKQTLKKEEDFKRLEDLCIANWESLMKRDVFKDKVKLTSMKDIDKILDERLAVILRKMKAD